ncbi:hypothetical protein HDZ31DRAFT_36115 [Schizophyllum fasciatum]
MATTLAFPADPLYATGNGDSTYECSSSAAARGSNDCVDGVLLLTAVRVAHFLSTGIESATIGFLVPEAQVQPVSIHVDADMSAAQALEATERSLAEGAVQNDDPSSLETVVCTGSPVPSRQSFRFAVFTDGKRLKFIGDARLYSPQNVACIAGNISDILAAIVGDPSTRLVNLSFPGALERLVKAGISLDPPPPPSYEATSLRDAFTRAVKGYPHNVALTDGTLDITYVELDALTDILADEIGVALVDFPNTEFISTCIPSSPLAIIVIYAIIKYGAAYVPLDVRLPESRLRSLIEDSGARLLITSADSPAISEVPIRRLDVTEYLERHRAQLESWKGSVRTSWRARPSELAYVLYTSGSTGAPKGVCMTALGVLSLIFERDVAVVTPDMRVGQISNIAWDGSILDVCCTLTVGATLVCFSSYDVLDPIRLAELFQARRVTALSVATSLFRQILAVAPQIFTDLRFIIIGGEALDFVQCRRFREFNPFGELIDGYGPTEACYAAVAHRVERLLERGPVPIGRPFRYTQCVVLDSHGRLVPPGIPGELYIGGRGLAAGYLNRPKETSAAFVHMSIPGLHQPPATFYRTGDMVRWLPGGHMQFERRVQTGQIKIRGQRLELAEVEAAIVGCPLAKDAGATYVKPTDGRSPYLAAFIVPAEDKTAGSLDPKAILRALKTSVPAYMVPHAVYVQGSLPLNNNGKLDRRALEAMALERDTSEVADETPLPSTSSPTDTLNDTEARIISILSEILGGKHLSSEDDFFDVGGHSLLAMQLKWRLDKEFDGFVPMQDIFQGASARRLAELMAKTTGGDASTTNVCIADAARSLNVTDRETYLPSSATIWQYTASRDPTPGQVVSHSPFWFRITGSLNENFLERALQNMTRRQDILRTVFDEVGGSVRASVIDWVPQLRKVDVPVAKRGSALESLLLEHASLPFRIASEPPFRPILFRLASKEYILLLSFDHIITDGFSEDIIVNELREYYDALHAHRAPVLSSLSVTCADVAHWERSDSFTTLVAPQLEYWATKLQHASAATFDPDLSDADPSTHHASADYVPVALSEEVVSRLDVACAASRVTFAMALLAALRVVHYRRSGACDAVLGAATATRQWPEVAPLQGFYVTALLYRIPITAGQQFQEVLAQVRTLVAEGVANMDAHMSMIAEALWKRGAVPAGSVPLRVALGYVVHENSCVEVADIKMERMEVNMHAVQLDMEIYFGRVAGTNRVTGEINYRQDLYSRSYAQGLARDLERVLEQFSEGAGFLID